MRHWIRALAQPTTYLGAVMIAAVWAGVYFLTNEAHDSAAAEGLRQGSNLARVFEEYIARVIKGADGELLGFRKLYARDPARFSFEDWIDGTSARGTLTVLYSITGPDGIVKLSPVGHLAENVDLSGREPFRVHVNAQTDELFIGAPMIGLLSGKRSIQLTRRLLAGDGSFAGVIGASLDLAQLEQFYDSVKIGPGGVIALVGLDGIIRARSGHDAGAGGFVGQSVAERRIFEMLKQSPAGSYWNSSATLKFDHVRRLISYRLVDGLPLIAIVGLGAADMFQEARATAQRYGLIGLFLTAIALFAVAIGARRELKLASATSALEASKSSLEQTNLVFDTALKNMAHGLCMFGAGQRLVVCNERYGRMYGLPPELTRAGTPLRAILQARLATSAAPLEGEHYVEDRLRQIGKMQPYYAVAELNDGRAYAIRAIAAWRLGSDPPGHHHPAAGRESDRLPGAARFAYRSAQQRRAARADGGEPGAPAAWRLAIRTVHPRSRYFQVGQRFARPPGRRRAAQDGGAQVDSVRGRTGHGRTARWR